jgi:hypothetical protein
MQLLNKLAAEWLSKANHAVHRSKGMNLTL